MLKRLLSLRDAFNFTVIKYHDKKKPHQREDLNDEDVAILQHIMEFLKPLEEMTMNISAAK